MHFLFDCLHDSGMSFPLLTYIFLYPSDLKNISGIILHVTNFDSYNEDPCTLATYTVK